jgi:hypothetical protein
MNPPYTLSVLTNKKSPNPSKVLIVNLVGQGITLQAKTKTRRNITIPCMNLQNFPF